MAHATGATLLAGGKRDGAMHDATLLENVPAECDVVKEEVFGPVVVMSRYATFKDAIAKCVVQRGWSDPVVKHHTALFQQQLQHARSVLRFQWHASKPVSRRFRLPTGYARIIVLNPPSNAQGERLQVRPASRHLHARHGQGLLRV